MKKIVKWLGIGIAAVLDIVAIVLLTALIYSKTYKVPAPAATIIPYIKRRAKAIAKIFNRKTPCFLPFFAKKLSFLQCLAKPPAILSGIISRSDTAAA